MSVFVWAGIVVPAQHGQVDGFSAEATIGNRRRPIPTGQAMAGRGGGGGGGKGAAGRMVSLQEFVSSMAPLIDLEKVFSCALSHVRC